MYVYVYVMYVYVYVWLGRMLARVLICFEICT